MREFQDLQSKRAAQSGSERRAVCQNKIFRQLVFSVYFQGSSLRYYNSALSNRQRAGIEHVPVTCATASTELSE